MSRKIIVKANSAPATPLLAQLQTLCEQMGVETTLTPDVVAKALAAHTSGKVKRLLTLCDPDAQRIQKAGIIAQCAMNADPDVVAARTLSDINRTLLQARTLTDLGEDVIAQYTQAHNLVKGAKSPAQVVKAATPTDSPDSPTSDTTVS